MDPPELEPRTTLSVIPRPSRVTSYKLSKSVFHFKQVLNITCGFCRKGLRLQREGKSSWGGRERLLLLELSGSPGGKGFKLESLLWIGTGGCRSSAVDVNHRLFIEMYKATEAQK